MNTRICPRGYPSKYADRNDLTCVCIYVRVAFSRFIRAVSATVWGIESLERKIRLVLAILVIALCIAAIPGAAIVVFALSTFLADPKPLARSKTEVV